MPGVLGAVTHFGSGDRRAAPLGPSVRALLGAVPGPLDGSRARRCLRERAAALRSRAGPCRCLRVPAGPGSPGPAVRAAWGPAGSGAASAPRTLPSTANKQLLSRGRRGEAAYLVAHFSLRPAKSLPHLFPSHVLAVGRLSAPQRCAWQVSHGASDGLSGAGTAGQQLPRVSPVFTPSALWPLRSGLRLLAAV